MSQAYAAIGQTPNRGGAKTCTKNPERCTVSALQEAVTELIKSQNPHKTWAFVADLFGLKERAAKHRLSNSVSYTCEELQALIQGEDGFEYLEALMAEAKPHWWLMIIETMTLARARHHQELARQQVLRLDSAPLEIPTRRRAKRIADADRQLSSSRAGKETALGLLLADRDRAAAGAVAPSPAPNHHGRQGHRAGGAR